MYVYKRIQANLTPPAHFYDNDSFYAHTPPYTPHPAHVLSVPPFEQEPPAADTPDDPPSPMPKGAVNRRRRVSVSAEVDTSKVNKHDDWQKRSLKGKRYYHE